MVNFSDAIIVQIGISLAKVYKTVYCTPALCLQYTGPFMCACDEKMKYLVEEDLEEHKVCMYLYLSANAFINVLLGFGITFGS